MQFVDSSQLTKNCNTKFLPTGARRTRACQRQKRGGERHRVAMADMQMVGEKTEGVEEIIVEDVIQPAMHTAPHPASPSADHQASVFGSPPQPPQPPPDVSACIIQGLMPLQGAEGVPGSGTMVAGAVPSSAMLGALTLVPIAKVGEGLPGGIKEDKQLPFMHAADKALRDAKKVCM